MGVSSRACRVAAGVFAGALMAAALPAIVPASASAAAANYQGSLTSVTNVEPNPDQANQVIITFDSDGTTIEGRMTFLEDGIIHYVVDPSGNFNPYATPNSSSHTARIQAQPDDDEIYETPEKVSVNTDGDAFTITAGETTVSLDKGAALMTIADGEKTVMEETSPIQFNGNATVQTLAKGNAENFFGGGMQNGRFIHTGNTINIANESNWVDGGVASPNPFYWSSDGYGVLRNTFASGSYNFGNGQDVVTATHNDNKYDAYIFVSDDSDAGVTTVAQDLLTEYYTVTGNPALIPDYAFYVGHYNAYNRDSWSDTRQTGYGSGWPIYGHSSYASGEYDSISYEKGGTGAAMSANEHVESLNGHGPSIYTDNIPEGVDFPYEFSAQAKLNGYQDYDMPLGYFLPNDGYGAGYGQNGYNMTGGVNADGSSSEARLEAVAANVENLKEFADYADAHGVATGLWTQSNLSPDSNSNTLWQTLRDFEAEVEKGGVTMLKTDVAWVGPGYSFGLNGTKTAYDIVTTKANERPLIVSLDGWAGSQRFASIWSGDQTGGNWEYIRFHIPTFIGQGLAGNPYMGSDMDGIFGGHPIVATRDYQWKTFIPLMLDMDGWGSYAKMPYTYGDPYTGINRMYLKIKAQLLPYLYTTAASASNVEDWTGNDDLGLPMVRAILLSDDSEYAASTATQYEFTLGEDFLVAPIYQNTDGDTANGGLGDGDDVRNNIYLPGDESTIWIDYWTGEQYTGGQVLNNFDAPIWKLPVFVKANAIIPMYEENNNPEPITDTNPDGTDRTKRIVEFYAIDGENDYTLYEDDGTYIENTTDTSDAEYGVQDNISYGPHVETTFTSKVDGDTATFTAGQSDGTYTGYDSNRTTTFVVNVSAEPSSVEAKNGDQVLTQKKVDSKEAFDAATPAAGEAIYFYDETPNLNSNAYSDDEGVQSEEFTKTEIISTPKLYVKFAQTDVNSAAQTLTVSGFENSGDLPENVLNENLATPANLAAPEDQKTPTSIALTWDAVEGATSYELKVDGVVFSIGDATTYNHTDLSYNSTHTYQVRARNAEGFSEWSEELSTASLQDPWRNVPTPTSIDWNGGDTWGAIENGFDHDLNTMFHSSDNTALGQPMVIDYGQAYQLDKFVYTPRQDNGGNGNVVSLKVETSLDGVNWVVQQESSEWKTGNNADGLASKTVELTGFARYVRLTALSSSGGFFSAGELALYKVDGTSGFEVGSLPSAPYTVGTEDVQHLEGNALGRENRDPYADEFQTHVGSKAFDINNNGVYDVYDMSFTMSKVYDGTTKTGAVDGSIAVIPSATSVKAGDVVTVDLYVSDAANVNALGSVIHFDGTKFELVADSIEGSAYIAGMEDESSSTTTFTDGTQTVNLAYVNEGDKALYNGTGVMATFQLKALADTDVTLSSTSWLVGPACDAKVVESDGTTPEFPEVPGPQVNEYGQDAFNITMTNDELTTDDGTNVEKLVQQGSYDGLFNGSDSIEFEFKWDIEGNHDAETGELPSYVKLPTTMTFEFNEASKLDNVEIRNRESGNGCVTSLKAKIYFKDGTTQDFSFDSQEAVYNLEVSEANAGKLVAKVDVTPLTSTGEASGGTPDNRMLSLREINFTYTDSAVTVESVELGDNETELYTGELARVDAKAVSTNDAYPYVDVTSSDPSVVSAVSVADADGNVVWFVRGNNAGTATITVASHLDPTKTATYDVTVLEGVDTSALEQAIKDAGGFSSSAYTEESYAALQKAVKAGQDLIASGSYSANAVASAAVAIQDAIDALEMRPVDESTLINTSAETNVTVVSQSSQMPASSGEDGEVDNVLDYDDQSYWHSNYTNAVYMPQYLIFDLGAEYDLTDVTFLPRQNGTNGDIFEVEILTAASAEDLQSYADNGYEATADSTVASLGTFSYDNNGRTLTDRTEWQQAAFAPQTTQYVMFKVNHSGGDVQDQYCSASEIHFYGTETGGTTPSVDKSELQALVDAIKAEGLKEEEYTEATWTPFENALIDAQSVLEADDATQEEVDAKLEDLQNAYDGLKKTEIPPVEKPDKTKLQELVDQVKGTDLSGKTEETVDRFESALKGAQEVLANDDATEAQIETAWNELKAAYDGLKDESEPEPPVVNFDDLNAAIDATGILNEDDYTAESWSNFQAALDAAKDVAANKDATQEQVDEALANLHAAQKALDRKPDTPVVDKFALSEAINKAEATDTTGKTEESVAALNEALEAAKAIEADENATQEQVDEALAKLQAALEGLQDVTEKPGGDDQKPGGDDQKPGGDDQKPGGDDQKPGGDTTKPGDDGQQGGSQQGGSGQQGGGLAQTSDPTSFVAVLATALAGAGALAISRKRR